MKLYHRLVIFFFFGAFVFFSVACATSTELSDAAESSDDSDDTIEPGFTCADGDIAAYDYMMAFHACASTCSDPSNHSVYLAGSDDGEEWTLLEDFETYAGSVPEIHYADDLLYIYTPGVVRAYDGCLDLVSEETVGLGSEEDTGGFVDPSVVEAGGETRLFYLPGILGQDPAGCSTYPCTKEIHSASPLDGSYADFEQVTGERVSVTLASGTASDPDILALADGSFLLYVSSGQSTLVYEGASLDGAFTSPDGDTPRNISNNSGGVPAAIQATDGNVWLFVTGRDSSNTEIIRRAVSADGITPIVDADFETAIDSSISSDFSSTVSVSSPSLILWPEP